MRGQIHIETDFATILVSDKESGQREWLMKHAVHQLVKTYKQEFGQEATDALLVELNSYHGGKDSDKA